MKPNFTVIGAMKCGTSTVCAYLEDHPQAFMLPGQEPNYFSHDENFAKGPGAYEQLFDAYEGEKSCGEGSNDYAAGALYPQSAARMAAFQPNMKIIYIVRHPMERMASAWVQNRADKGDLVPATLDAAVTSMPSTFVDQSLYWANLSRYRAHFPDNQIFVGFMEDLKSDREAFFKSLCDFLEIPTLPAVKRGHQNPSAGKVIPSRRYSKLNQLPMMAQIKRLFPKSLKSTIRSRWLSEVVTAPPTLGADARAAVMKEIQPDATALLAHCGKPEGFWRLE